MKRDCPTIQELLAFDAVARYTSVSQAAEALCITVSAVSKQLASLEHFIGRPLLEKKGRGVQLTPLGQSYWLRISTGLRRIEAATFEIRADRADTGMLTLACVPTFLTKWLIPRLPEFRRLHPGVTLSFSQHVGPFDPMPLSVDVAIRYGNGDWPGTQADYVAGREFVVIAAPSLQYQLGHKLRPTDMMSQTLLHHEEAPTAWQLWAEQAGVPQLPAYSGPRFAQYAAVIQAAASGLGLALVPRVLVLDELARGELIQPFAEPVAVGQGHYLCYRSEYRDAPLLVAFRDWILKQAA